MSHVICHMSYFFFGPSGEAYLWRVCYQQGLPRLVFFRSGHPYKIWKLRKRFFFENKQHNLVFLFQMYWKLDFSLYTALKICLLLMGCSDIMSAKNGGLLTPLPPLSALSAKNQKLTYPPLSEKIWSWLTLPPPLVRNHIWHTPINLVKPIFKEKFKISK